MNLRLVVRLLGIVAMLIGVMMAFSLPFAMPDWNGSLSLWESEQTAFADGEAEVGSASGGESDAGEEAGKAKPTFEIRGFWALMASMLISLAVGAALFQFGRGGGRLYRKEAMAVVGLSWALATVLGALPYLLSRTECAPGTAMGVADALFESQSGFSTTGATVITDLENWQGVPRCILFWRSTTHLLGGLGIIVLFVVILGQGSAGKALMRTEMPGPSQDTPQARMQHTAWLLFLVYAGMNVALTALLLLEGLSVFDALCHAFGTMATGGFSTYNASLGHFSTVPGLNGALIEMTVLVFMAAAGTNFLLLYRLLIGQPGSLFRDFEWRTYVAVLAGVTLLIMAFGVYAGDFDSTWESFRYGSFQVASILTTTGYGTHDFDAWNNFGRGVLFLLMFVGGCAGSTGGGLKVIRHILFLKIMWLELERAFHPTVVRPLRLAGKALEDQDLRRQIVVYFGLILVIFVFSWIALVAIEPDSSWKNTDPQHKLIDCASGVAATLNNIGPGLGTIGATKNYQHFTAPSKLLFTVLMMIGRLEIYAIVVLFVPSFWRSQ